jgi:acyl-CoA thioesterase-1
MRIRNVTFALEALCLFLCVLSGAIGSAYAGEALRIVALGASNTNGKGVASSEAWPAQLEGMLQAKGYSVSMSVSAINGETSAEILGRADSAIPAGTQVVVYDTGQANDKKRDVSEAERQANIAQLRNIIRQKGAVAIEAPYSQIPRSLKQADGIHWNAEGHARIAALLVPQVIAATHGSH